MYGCGLRLMESLRLRIKDLDFENDLLMVRSGKGEKDRALVDHDQLIFEIHIKKNVDPAPIFSISNTSLLSKIIPGPERWDPLFFYPSIPKSSETLWHSSCLFRSPPVSL